MFMNGLSVIGFFICQLVLFLLLSALPTLYLFGCFLSDWKCSGDSMGGIMMVYAFSLFPISLASVPIFGCFYLAGVRKLRKEQRFLLRHNIWLHLIIIALSANLIVFVVDFLK